MTWVFSRRSWVNLAQVHPDLQQLAAAALLRSPYDFGIIDGARTLEEQRGLLASGATRTLASRHRWAWPLSGKGNLRTSFKYPVAHAIDYGVFVSGRLVWVWELYERVWREAWLPAARELGASVTWGGAWPSRDGPHVQLSKAAYPAQFATEAEEQAALKVMPEP